MRLRRPVFVLTSIAAGLVLWFIVRMGMGSHLLVWKASCLLGAWAPLLSALLYAYVRTVQDREHSVGAAWLVRAIAMHCVLLWMIGVGDWLAGFGPQRNRWLADVAAPLVLLGFAPVFLGCHAAIEWVRSVAKRVPRSIEKPALPTERGEHAAFRGVRVVRETVHNPARATWAYVLGVAAVAGNVVVPEHAVGVTLAGALFGAILAMKNSRAFAPSIALLAAAPIAGVLTRAAHGDVAMWSAMAVAPWIAMVAVGALLLPLDLSLRLRDPAALPGR